MTEILTESFCERCGTRYTFETVPPRRKPLRAIGTLGRGLKHFVSDPGSTIDEAMAVARSEQEQRSTANALEAFHRTFNFCLSCRQYTCSDCWNPVEGRCLSCAPTPEAAPPVVRADTLISLDGVARQPMGHAPIQVQMLDGHDHADGHASIQPAEAALGTAAEDDAARLAAEEAARVAAADAAGLAAEAAAGIAEEQEAGRIGEDARARAEAEAVAEAEAAAVAQAAVEAEAAAVAQAAVEAEAAAVAQAQAEADAAALAESDAAAAARQQAEERSRREERAQAEAAAEAAAAQAAAEAAAEARSGEETAAEAGAPAAGSDADASLLSFAPGTNLDDELAAYEREHPAAIFAAQPADEAVVSEPISAGAPQPVAVPIVESEPPSWPDPVEASSAFEPHWPDVAVARRAPEAAVASSLAGAREATAAVAAPSASAYACPSCGLSLSASARFCRRCGTPQQVDVAR